MYDTSDLRKGLKILVDGDPYIVIEAQFVKPGKGAAFTRTKMKNLLTGGVIERNIRSGEKLEPAAVEEREMQYLYKEGDAFVFMDTSNYEQMHIQHDVVGEAADFMKDNTNVQVLLFNERPIGVTLPNFVDLRIVKSDPAVRGDTATNVTKPATLETGAVVQVPLFVNEGEVIRIDTRSGQYVERVSR
ncbi:MAG TPA: elongation factor P [Polyangia bacterium]|nr:elongation factor P [Polyangia bacterium]